MRYRAPDPVIGQNRILIHDLIFQVDVHYKDDGSKTRLFVKASVKGTQIFDLEGSLGIFAREKFMYTTVLPKMREFQLKKSSKSNVLELVPR